MDDDIKLFKAFCKWAGAYVFIAFLTFGWAYNSKDCLRDDPKKQRICEHMKPPMSALAGAIWPAYWATYPISWAGSAAIYLTR